MNYQEGIIKLKELSNGLNHTTRLYEESFVPYKDIIIEYPGKKSNGDYRLSKYRNGQAPTHLEICRFLYNLINIYNYTFTELSNFLIDIYFNGTNSPYTDQTLEDLKHLIFWTTLQEEINYPQSRGKAGIRLPYCRYYEAIYCASHTHTCSFTLNDVINRCNNHGCSKPHLYDLPNPPEFYCY